MTLRPRQMRLTPELVARVAPHLDAPKPIAPGHRASSDGDYDGAIKDILARRPDDREIWVFAYGSLIWKPCFDHIEQRIARAHGWHRSFCLGWDRRFRGSPERPGLMMALDHGGQCKGVAYRLPPDAIEANLDRLFRREMPMMPSPLPARWIGVATDVGATRCITFVIDRKALAYVGGLSPAEVADALAVAAGQLGSMADYLYSTVKHLEDLGLHDKHLWTLQEMVAERIEAATK